MQTRLLIDAIVQQTTVLIAQLSTAAGIRAPLAHIADQVFLQLSREIEAQGVGRKVVADMFGMAIRSYQKKVQRLTESQTDRGTTLWHAVLNFLNEQSVTRGELLSRFRHDPEREVLAVLNDLVSSGFAYSTGRGLASRYGPTSREDRKAVLQSDETESLMNMMWLEVQRHEPLESSTLLARYETDGNVAQVALGRLLDDGRVIESEGLLTAQNFVVPYGAEQGWEAAVLDHFQTMVRAVTTKLRLGQRAGADDRVGGSTLSFSVYPGHPKQQEVYALLQRVRDLSGNLWKEVSEYNGMHPPPADAERVSFYFGQTIDGDELE